MTDKNDRQKSFWLRPEILNHQLQHLVCFVNKVYFKQQGKLLCTVHHLRKSNNVGLARTTWRRTDGHRHANSAQRRKYIMELGEFVDCAAEYSGHTLWPALLPSEDKKKMLHKIPRGYGAKRMHSF